MKQFSLGVNATDRYKAVVYTTGYRTALNYLTEVHKDLLSMGIKEGTILFDDLLHSGNTTSRYFTAELKDEGLVDFKRLTVPKRDQIRVDSMNFFSAHKEVIEFSILSSVQKRMILHRIAI